MEEGKKHLHLISVVVFTISAVVFVPVDAASLEPVLCESGSIKHFVLVHGACHGAWSWYKLVALLRSSGHNVTALDLTASGISPKQVNDVPLVSNYFQPLTDFMASLPRLEKVILVAHSLGGLAISQAMERFPDKISVAVFVTALMPGPTLNISTLSQESSRRQGQLLDNHFTYDNGPNNPPTAFIFGPSYLSEYVYQHSPIEDLALATLMVRPLRLYAKEDLSSELMLSSDKYGSVSRVFVVAEADKVLQREFQRWMIENNPPSEILEIKGSDHMVMMSRPTELFVCLLGIGGKFS